MNDTFDFTLKSSLTKEQINLITDAEFEHTDRIWFVTPNGKHVEFVKAPQWIPCSKRLPRTQEDVLCDDDGLVTIGYYTDEEVGWHDKHCYRIYPTAWMPLPKPYKERK